MHVDKKRVEQSAMMVNILAEGEHIHTRHRVSYNQEPTFNLRCETPEMQTWVKRSPISVDTAALLPLGRANVEYGD